ncbi:syndecan-2-like isoform X2 [Lampris incognitus]|uniref:syndecan-2-like isoform X2 n=1 Tax=Lampris incognitus TaxID=2546036 RepID=UPI0024B4DC1D|nr:syndecan-2-like isoform X2 [Lampris incognitus]
MRSAWMLLCLGLATGFIADNVLSQSPSSSADDLYLEGRPSGDFPVDDEDGESFASGSGSGDYSLADVILRESSIRRFVVNISETTTIQEVIRDQTTAVPDSPANPLTTVVDSEDPLTTAEGSAPPQFAFPDESTKMDTEVDMRPTVDWFIFNTSPSSSSIPPIETTTAWYSIDGSPTKDSAEDVLVKKGVQVKDGKDDQTYTLDVPEEVTSENLWERTEVLAAVIACGVIGFLCALLLLILFAYRMKKKDEGSYDLGERKLPPTAYQKAPTKEFYA